MVVIAQGRIEYDGSLAGIVDQFSGHKIVTLAFSEDRMPEDLASYGEVLEVMDPKAKLKIARADVTEALAKLLANHAVEDVSVEDPPLEDVIAEVFSSLTVAASAT